MKVIHIIPNLKQGGAESQLERLIDHSKGDVEHVVITLEGSGSPIQSRLKKSGIVCLSCEFKYSTFFRATYELRTLIEKNFTTNSVLQCWMYQCNLLGFLIGKSLGISERVVWNIRRTQIPSGKTGIVAKVCGLLTRLFTINTIYCARAAKLSHTAIGYSERNTKVILNGIDTEKFRPNLKMRHDLRLSYELSDKNFVIGMVGRFAEVKGHVYLLEAITRIIERKGAADFNIKLVLVGRGIKDAPSLRPLLEKLEKISVVSVLNERGDIWEVMNGFDLLCLPSKSEGFPNVVAEAMACGVPAVVTNVGDASFIVNDQQLVVEPCNSVALAEGIWKYMCLSQSEKLDLKREVRARVCNSFSLLAAWDSYLKLYNKLLDK